VVFPVCAGDGYDRFFDEPSGKLYLPDDLAALAGASIRRGRSLFTRGSTIIW
jgi:hypothetical protein